MYVALLTDAKWLKQESATLRHLIVGMMDEHVRVAQVVPKSIAETDTLAFGERVTWTDTSWQWLRQKRVKQLAPALERLEINLLHVLQEDLWSAALSLAKQLQIPLVLDIYSFSQIREVPQIIKHATGVRIGFSATTASFAQTLRERLGPAAVIQIIPPGLYQYHKLPKPLDEKTFCGLVSGNGIYDADYEALLKGIAKVVDFLPDSQFFFEATGENITRIWQSARRLNILSHVNLVPYQLGNRELLMRVNALILPQALGHSRNLILDAMVHGIAVLAKEDPWIDYLRADQTAWLISETTPHAWQALILRCAKNPAEALSLGKTAQAWVNDRHTVARQIELTLAMYRRLTGASFKFPTTEGR